jgi:hypothetical protein
MSCGGFRDRYAKAPISTNEEYGHAETSLLHVVAPITLALRKPKFLGYNGTTGPDIIIENPCASPMYQKRGFAKMRRRIKDEMGTTPIRVADCFDRCCVGYFEEESN